MHLDILQKQVKSLVVEGELYGVSNDRDTQTGEIVILGEPPVHEWGAMVGDVVDNLRSALDHLVWQLTLANGHTPPAVIPLKRSDPDYWWRRVSFPIHTLDTRKRYPSGRRIPWRFEPPEGFREFGQLSAQTCRRCSRLTTGRMRPNSR